MSAQKSATGVGRHRPGERETIGSVATRALTEDSVEAGWAACGCGERYQDRVRGPFTGESQDHIPVCEVTAAPAG